MPSNLESMNYPYNEMKLNKVFKNKDINLPTLGIDCNELRKVYGEALMFGEIPKDRPYTYSSLVTSIDGRIAFTDDPEGPLIASKNFLSKLGSTTDWWTLNILRSSADGIIFGANTLSAEPNGTGHVYDNNLEKARELLGRESVPWNIIPTLDGSDIPFDHIQFTCGEVPIIFYTSPAGLKTCKKNAKKETIIIGPYNTTEEIIFKDFIPDKNKVYIIVTGENNIPNNKVGLKILRKMGIEKLLVESPTLTHIFMEEELMDELFLNYSCVYLGGKSLTMGMHGKEFTSTNHPHTELISIFMYSPHYMYLRHKVIYGVYQNV
ncbi:RibD family protein [Clostridium oceanicum]|uniref:Bacterial bifunctional deaminase-reductase C-terminal domain-containing protein n=1 Tax=Clostridium oceanicum TaxID=1543 RepID=A0ABN1J8Q3_9CLOT